MEVKEDVVKEENVFKCYKCGGKGHIQKDCPSVFVVLHTNRRDASSEIILDGGANQSVFWSYELLDDVYDLAETNELNGLKEVVSLLLIKLVHSIKQMY